MTVAEVKKAYAERYLKKHLQNLARYERLIRTYTEKVEIERHYVRILSEDIKIKLEGTGGA